MKNPFTTFFAKRRSRRRDYASSERSANPIFKKPATRSTLPWMFLALFVVALGAFVYVLFAPQYRITSVTVSGAVKLDAASIAQFVNGRLDRGLFGLQWRRVTYLTPTASITKDLRTSIERLISLNGLTIERVGRNSLTVNVQERTPHLIWETANGTRYFIDEKGIVVERVTSDVPSSFRTLVDSNGISADIGSQVVRPEYISTLETIEQRLPILSVNPVQFSTWIVECRKIEEPTETNTNENSNVNEGSEGDSVLNINVNTATDDHNTGQTIDDAPCDYRQLAVDDPTLVVTTDEGWDIRMDISTNLDTQLKKLQVTLQQKFEDSREGLEYIDVRFGNKVYYK